MSQARVTELERDAAAQRAGRAAFETEVREMASVELEKRVGVAMQQIEVATHKLTGVSSFARPMLLQL